MVLHKPSARVAQGVLIDELLQTFTGVPGIYILCALCGIAVPLPEDVCVIFAGVQVSTGLVGLAPALGAAYVGILTRDIMAWTVGRILGGWLLSRPVVLRLLGADRLAKAAGMVETRGSMAVLVGRGLVGMRMPVFIMSGATGIPLSQFVLWDLLGLLITTPILVGIGYVFGAPAIELVQQMLARFGWVPIVVVILVIVVVALKLKSLNAQDAARSSDASST